MKTVVTLALPVILLVGLFYGDAIYEWFVRRGEDEP